MDNKSFERYAKYYDLIYQDKDYEKECDFIEEIFRSVSARPVKSVLDGGCGSGGHAIPLAARGYEVTGIDKSEIMIQHAKVKAERSDLRIDFCVEDLQEFNLNKQFDACILMFSVIDYITETEDIIKALKNIKRHLKQDSLLVLDFWNGLAVLRTLPSVRVKTVHNEKMRIIRIAEPDLDALSHLCRVHYRLLVNQGETLTDEIQETHVIRYYFPLEIGHYLADAGFQVLRICPFLELNKKLDEIIWNGTVIAKVA